MNDTERVIGALQEFKDDSKKRFDKLESQVESLLAFKWRVAGAFAFLLTAVEVGKTFLETRK